jgi:RNA polymerase primary sigma factor
LARRKATSPTTSCTSCCRRISSIPRSSASGRRPSTDEGVQVLSREEAKDAAKPKLATRKVMPKRDEEGEDEPSRTNDPVRMYLRKMGSVSL